MHEQTWPPKLEIFLVQRDCFVVPGVTVPFDFSPLNFAHFCLAQSGN